MIWETLNLDTLFLRSHCCPVRRVPYNAAACVCVLQVSFISRSGWEGE